MSAQAAAVGIDLTKQALDVLSKKAEQSLKFDFVALGTKLVVFFIVSYIIAKVFEGIIFGNNVFIALAKLVGVNVPDTLPENLVNFWKDGINGFRYWDIVKALANLLVLAEWFQW